MEKPVVLLTLDAAQRAKKKNVIELSLDFSAMTRLLRKDQTIRS
jgi:hypothetical protein